MPPVRSLALLAALGGFVAACTNGQFAGAGQIQSPDDATSGLAGRRPGAGSGDETPPTKALDPRLDKNHDGKIDGAFDKDGDGKLDSQFDKNGDGKLDSNADVGPDGKIRPEFDANRDGKLDAKWDKNGDGKIDEPPATDGTGGGGTGHKSSGNPNEPGTNDGSGDNPNSLGDGTGEVTSVKVGLFGIHFDGRASICLNFKTGKMIVKNLYDRYFAFDGSYDITAKDGSTKSVPMKGAGSFALPGAWGATICNATAVVGSFDATTVGDRENDPIIAAKPTSGGEACIMVDDAEGDRGGSVTLKGIDFAVTPC